MCFTWNVGNAEPDKSELGEWLPAGGEPYDLIVVGTQENQFKTTEEADDAALDDDAALEQIELENEENSKAPAAEVSRAPSRTASGKTRKKIRHVVKAGRTKGKTNSNKWDQMVSDQLGNKWACVETIFLEQMRLSVYAKQEYCTQKVITGVQSSYSATGIAGVLGNKGGLVVKLNFGSTSLCFVSSHLAAHSHKLKQRNENCSEILSETMKAVGEPKLEVISEFDHIFWLGDLNYRVDLGETMDTESQVATVIAMVKTGKYPQLLKQDQLKASQRSGEAFVGFTEIEPDFPPSFKVLRQKGVEHKEQRVPSYCDRVLWKSMPQWKDRVQPLSQRMLADVSTSDHKPVCATFNILATRPLDKVPHNSAPVIRISNLEVQGLIDSDVAGGNDPYVVFFTNPEKLLDTNSPTTSIKSKRSGLDITSLLRIENSGTGNVIEQAAGKVGAAAGAVADTCQSAVSSTLGVACNMATAGVGVAAGALGVSTNTTTRPIVKQKWKDSEVPLLRPKVAGDNLKHVSLIMAIFDHDKFMVDDPLGTVIVHLKPPEGVPADATEYVIDVDEHVNLGNVTRDHGRLRCKMTISLEDHLDQAIKLARQDSVGSKSGHVRGLKMLCC